MDETQVECKKSISEDTLLLLISRRKKILSLHVTSEQVHDSHVLPELVDDIIIKQNKVVETAIMDGSYDSNNNFQFYHLREFNQQ
jgi:hypothetical protein